MFHSPPYCTVIISFILCLARNHPECGSQAHAIIHIHSHAARKTQLHFLKYLSHTLSSTDICNTWCNTTSAAVFSGSYCKLHLFCYVKQAKQKATAVCSLLTGLLSIDQIIQTDITCTGVVEGVKHRLMLKNVDLHTHKHDCLVQGHRK